jgi:uncharacterized membrane protein YgcG
MKRLRLLLFVPVLMFLLSTVAPAVVSAQTRAVENFQIESFTANYYLGRNAEKEAELRVVEEITAVFPNYDQNRGILRALPERYNKTSLRLNVTSVTNELGENIPFTSSSDNDNEVLRIGNPDVFVRGRQTYVISYTMRDVVTFYDGHDEWYWNVNGTQWAQAAGSVTARIHIPNGLAAEISKPTKCFTGVQGSTASNCEVKSSVENDMTIINVRAANVAPRSNLTFVMGFNDNTFMPYVPTTWERVRIFVYLSPIVILPLLTGLWAFRRWQQVGRDPKGRGVVVAQYVPPNKFHVLKSEGILRETIRQQATSAAIIELATQKYIVIHEIASEKKKSKPEYSLELKMLPTGLAAEQQQLVHALFGTKPKAGDVITLKSKANKLYTELDKIDQSTMERLFTEGYFSNNPRKARRSTLIAAVVLLLVGGVLAFTVVFTPIGVGMVTSALILFAVGKVMPARTTTGVEMLEHLRGLEVYMKMAEKDRIKMLQSPEGVRQFGDPSKHGTQVKLFETLLPYAMLFGIEKQWAKQFESLYAKPPDWYQGNVSAFHAGYLANSLTSFGTATSTTFSAPSSSGSSGYSGGGGFSGGGGGGGGGGGW